MTDKTNVILMLAILLIGFGAGEAFIIFSGLANRVIVSPPDICTINQLGDDGLLRLNAVYEYKCPYGTWLGVIHSDGKVTWSKAP